MQSSKSSQVTAKRLKGLIKDRKLSVWTVAKGTGIHPQNIYAYLRGREPLGDKLKALAAYFGVSTDFLLGADDKSSVAKASNN